MAKVTIIGCGAVGEAIANALVIGDVCSDLVLYDVVKDKLRGMVLDFQHGQDFHATRVIEAIDWEDTINSDVVVITAGVRQREGESRRDLMGRNKAIMEHIVPPMAKHSPMAIVIVVANPCDFMTQLVQQMSGFPKGRVFGSGTNLDSSRLRTEIGRKLGIAPESVSAYVLGEHGDASVVPIGTATVGSCPLTELMTLEELQQAHKTVIEAAGTVIKLRGYTSTAIGMSVGKIVEAILRDKRVIMPLSCPALGRCGVTQDIYMSLPCIVDKDGVKEWKTVLPAEECKKLQETAQVMFDVSKEILALAP
jgi:L-lactate dehydrogenase